MRPHEGKLTLWKVEGEAEKISVRELAPVHTLSIGSLQVNSRSAAFLGQCPNVTTFECNVFEESGEVPLGQDIMPALQSFAGPVALAKLLMDGRHIQKFKVPPHFMQPLPLLNVLLLEFTTKPENIAGLDLCATRWEEESLLETLGRLPSLKNLALEVDSVGNHGSWLQNHLVEVVGQLPLLETLSFVCKRERGPPEEEILVQQVQVLQSARASQGHLREVSFRNDTTWRADTQGRWTAVYEVRFLTRQILFSPLDYLSPEENVGHSNVIDGSKPSPRVPNDVLFNIVEEVDKLRSKDWRPAILGRYEAPNEAFLLLKRLSLGSRLLRQFAQHFLFSTITLSGGVTECLFRLKKLLKIFDADKGRLNWPRTISLSWYSQNIGETLQQTAEEMQQQTSSLFQLLENLHTIFLSTPNITPEVYAHLYQLASLRQVSVFEPITPRPRFIVPNVDTKSLTIEKLTLDFRSQDPDTGLINAVAALASSPALRILELDVTQSAARRIVLRHIAEGLVNLNLKGHDTTPEDLLFIADRCPKIQVLRFGTMPPSPTQSPVTLPSDKFPVITSVTGCLTGVRMITPGRRVEKIEVWPQASLEGRDACSEQLFSPLAKGSAPLKELCIRGFAWKPKDLLWMAKLFSELEILDVTFRYRSLQGYAKSDIKKHVQSFKKLRSFSIQGWYEDDIGSPGFVVQGPTEIADTADS